VLDSSFRGVVRTESNIVLSEPVGINAIMWPTPFTVTVAYRGVESAFA
jgi:hypothetical protein